MPEPSPNPTSSGHLGQPRSLQRNGRPLTPNYRYELPEDVPRVVSWGDQDHLTYAAHLLTFDAPVPFSNGNRGWTLRVRV